MEGNTNPRAVAFDDVWNADETDASRAEARFVLVQAKREHPDAIKPLLD